MPSADPDDISGAISETKSHLGAIIQAPPLSDNVLARPPFRYIYDVIVAVQKANGFAEGLFSSDELDFSKLKDDKTGKQKFLQKVFDYVTFAGKDPVVANVKAVLGGKEPAKTNQFFVALAKCSQMKGSQAALVQKFLGKSSSGAKEEKKSKSESKQQPSKPEKEEVNGSEPSTAPPSGARMPRPTSARGNRRVGGEPPQAATLPVPENAQSNHASSVESSTKSSPQRRPSAAAARKQPPSAATQPPVQERIASSTAPRPPPRAAVPLANDVSSAGVAQQPARLLSSKPRTTVIVEKTRDSDSDQDDFVVKEAGISNESAPMLPVSKHADEKDEEGQQHGALVSKMLEQKAVHASGDSKNASAAGVSQAQAKKQHDLVVKEMTRMGGQLQSITRIVQPMARLVDFLQEDLDSMQREASGWADEYRLHIGKLRDEQTVTHSVVEPLKSQLARLNAAISDKQDEIFAVKSNIVQNEDRITKMLQSVTKNS